MDVAATTSRNDSTFVSAMGCFPSTSNDSPFLSSRTIIRSDCPEKVRRFDESNVSCFADESIVSLGIDSDSSCALPISSSSKRGRGRPRKIARKGAGRPRKVSICDSVPDECVIVNDEPIIFLNPDPPDMPVRQSVPVRQSERIKNRKLSITQDPAVQPILSSKKNPITDNNKCLSTHEGFPCADTRARHTAEYYDSGDIGKFECHYCKALLLESEINQSHKSKFKVITSSLCCSCGTVTLPPYTEHPNELKVLLKGDTKESKEFLSNHNTYNSLLAFASISVGHKDSSHHGSVCLMLNGEFSRHISSMNSGHLTPSFSQLYILDANEALNLRTQNTLCGGDRVNPQTLKILDSVLRNINPFAKVYKNFHSQYMSVLEKDGKDAVRNFRLTIIEERAAPAIIRGKGLHPRQVNLPQEKAMFSVWTESSEPPKIKGTYITDLQGCLFEVKPYNARVDSLTYPLLFPHGDDGYHTNIPFNPNSPKYANKSTNNTINNDEDITNDITNNTINNDEDITNEKTDDELEIDIDPKKTISYRKYIRYRLAIRRTDSPHNIWSAGGGLSQKFVLDYAARIDAQVADYLRQPEFNLLKTTAPDVLNHMRRDGDLQPDSKIGSVVLFRKYHPGTRPYFQDMFYDATTIMARTRKPGLASFMFTFTTNPYWPEISRNFFHKGQKIVDRFDILCRVYADKLRRLHFLLDKKNIFGKILGYAESMEFQKRIGGPHLHRVFCLDTEATAENIDGLIWAHIPKRPDDSDKSAWANFIRKIRELLPKFQIHDCGDHCKGSNGRCLKGFPKPYRSTTILHDNKPAEYKRPSPEDGGHTLTLEYGSTETTYTNSRIVPYNPLILVMFECHHNLEYAYGQSDNLKYALKYPFKGPSFSYIKCKDGTVNIDEPAQYARMLYRSPPEAHCRIYSQKYAYLSHTVIPLSIHLPREQNIYFESADQLNDAADGILPETHLTQYWKMWRNNAIDKNILYEICLKNILGIRKIKSGSQEYFLTARKI
uniref:Helitron helicase-like domain-containing protein n=1 Tax=Meloidogyne enterolobii TaxID=390850 RepID=A0A6V7YAB6_MELEN|nr:unnamed protein product [Meloidogyne enterolobii]